MVIRKALKHLAWGLSPALLWTFCATGPVQAQETSADHTITLTKVVEVYEFEDVKVSVDQYQVKGGDTLAKILKSRGLLSSAADEAQMMRLVKNLNPELSNVNLIQPGQSLNLPAELKDETPEGEPAAPAAGAAPATVTETVKVYERPQPTQQSARVVVMRHRPGEGSVEAAPDLDFPSGNYGPLDMVPETGVVYRTVKIRKGDTLERLLRREGMDSDLIYAHLLKVTLELNPEIRDRDMIFAGAELRIPAAGEYLASLAGVNPTAVKEAALARSEGRAPEPANARAEALRLPSATVETAKNTLGLIFTRLGAKIDTRGRLVLPVGAEGLEFNTAEFPVIELPGNRRVVLDLEARLPRDTVAALRNMPEFQVFRPARGERFEKYIANLWSLCGFYRVYDKKQSYEGGTDIKLSIAADWIIWPTQAAWQNGQPLALSLAAGPEKKTSAAWKAFLARHGVEVLDIFQGSVLPDDPAGAVPPLKLTDLKEENPSLMAAELVKLLGAEPKVGVQLDGLTALDKAAVTAPVLWEHNGRQVVLEFGELDPVALKTMKEANYMVVSAGSSPESVISAVREGFGLKSTGDLMLKAPRGGPAMSLSVKGDLLSLPDRQIFFTALEMPAGIGSLLPPNLEIVRYY